MLNLPASAQQVHPVTKRPIAPVMGSAGADWLNRPERQKEENTALVLADLGLTSGMVVADIGAGTGYYSIRIAKRILPGGKVYAEDIQHEMLALLRANAKNAGVENIATILGTAADPKLPVRAIDLAIMVDVYHELSQPQSMLRAIRAALKPDGQLVLLEFRKEDPKVPILPAHKMSLDQVTAEIEPEGYHLVRDVENLPWQHMIFFGVNGGQ